MKWLYSFFPCFLFIQSSFIAKVESEPTTQDLKKEIESYLSLPALKEALGFSAEDIKERGKKELATCLNVWEGGYYEGNPQDKWGTSSYAQMDYKGEKINALYPCYLECIVPYVADKDVLEIGPGRGCWTKTILAHEPKSVTCLDAKSAKQNRFWEYIGDAQNVHYIQITDFSVSEIPDNSLDYVFSFGTFCHISPLLIQEYLKNLYPKLRSGAKCFIMYADYLKYADYFAVEYKKCYPTYFERNEIAVYQSRPKPFVFYHLGINRAEAMLAELGYTDISVDIGANHRDPIMYFVKP